MARPEAKPKTPFGVRLRSLRKSFGVQQRHSANYTAEEFAVELGMHPERYRSWERGITRPPLDKLIAIKNKTAVSLDWLISGDNPAKSKAHRAGSDEETVHYLHRA